MPAVKSLDSEGDRDIITDEPLSERGETYLVSTRQAIARLSVVSSGAAKWFQRNCHTPFLSFRANEAEIIQPNVNSEQITQAIKETVSGNN